MFVDASALAAIVLGEPEARGFAERIEADPDPVTSPIAIYETVLALARERAGGLDAAQADVRELLDVAGIRVVAVVPEDAATALRAFARYGKGRGHPARLNMGDCFAYAVARRHGIVLLFKGDDFNRTDIEV